jgi:hypothetical protein
MILKKIKMVINKKTMNDIKNYNKNNNNLLKSNNNKINSFNDSFGNMIMKIINNINNADNKVKNVFNLENKKKFMKNLKKNPNEYFPEENNYETDFIQKNKTSTDFLPRYKFKDTENTVNQDRKEFFSSRNENDKNDMLSNHYHTYDKEQNEVPSKKNILRFKPKLYIDANNYNSFNGNPKSSSLSKTNKQFYNGVERIKTYQSMDRKNLLKIKKQPYFHILNEQSIQN